MDKIHISIFLLLGITLFLSGMALIGVQNNSNTNLTDAVNGLIVELDEIGKTNNKLIGLIFDLENNMESNQTAIYEKFDLFQNEIVKIKNDIRNKFPQASTVEQEEQTVISETPFLTLTIEKTEWLLGDILVFTGAAHPSDLVSITIKLPDRTLLQGTALPSDIVNGMYRIEIATSFDHSPGTWVVFAKQAREQSNTITFKVE